MRLSKNVEAFRPSPIRAMLRVVSNPNIISFAGGMPGEDLFPIDDVREMVQVVPRKMMEIGLQYGTTDGLSLLIEEIKKGEAVYVEEYIVNRAGDFQFGTMQIQCMMAPEFSGVLPMPCKVLSVE